MKPYPQTARWAVTAVSVVLGAAFPAARAAQDLFVNAGVLQATYPPVPLPMIDAYRLVNLGIIGLTNVLLPQPIEFQNTVFITNRGQWWGSPGYRFETIDLLASPQRRPAAVFHNEGLVTPNTAEIRTDRWLLVWATNIINRGRLEIGPLGQLNLTGDFLDLRGGELRFTEADGQGPAARTYDLHWGFSTNQISGRFTGPPLTSPGHTVQTLSGTLFTWVVLPTGFSSHVLTNGALIQAVYVYNGGETLDTEVRMTDFLSVIRWRGTVTNPVTGAIQTNELYLTESLTPGNYEYNLTNGTLYAPSLSPSGASRPFNFVLSGAPPWYYAFMPVVPSGAFDAAVFTQGTNVPVQSTNAGYRTRVIPAYMVPSETQPGSTFTNVGGRVEILARESLDLRETRLSAPSLLRLEATNHFVGNTGAQIEAPYSSLRLGSANGLLEVRNLVLPRVPRIVGDLQAWVGIWTNITAEGQGLIYKVLMVSNYFQPAAEPMLLDLELISHYEPREVRIADKLSVIGSFSLDAERLTLTTNLPAIQTLPPWVHHPFHPMGELNLLTNRISWAESLPRLRFLTNQGIINIENAATLAGIRRPPHFPTVSIEPYEAVINEGRLSAHALDIRSSLFENDGIIVAEAGPLRIESGQARLGSKETNLLGQLRAPMADVELQSGRMLVTNQVIEAGRRLVLGATELLSDGDTTNNVFTARDGLTLTRRPASGDLRGTTISNVAAAYGYNVTVWAGEDRGPVAIGFTNNAAIGRLILDGALGARFSFQGLGLHNALYVDQLILLNHAAQEWNNAFIALDIAPNITIYYADLIVDGRRLAEPVDASRYNNGRLRWVPTYADGFYGSTEIEIGARKIRVNKALRESTELDSDGDGIVNALDPFPVLVPEDVPVTATWEGPGAVVLTWPSLPGMTNTVWEATSLNPPDWRVVVRTNFAALPLAPAEPCSTPPCPVNLLPGRAAVRLPAAAEGARFYRVEVQVPIR